MNGPSVTVDFPRDRIVTDARTSPSDASDSKLPLSHRNFIR